MREDPILLNDPLYCPKCKQETRINVQEILWLCRRVKGMGHVQALKNGVLKRNSKEKRRAKSNRFLLAFFYTLVWQLPYFSLLMDAVL